MEVRAASVHRLVPIDRRARVLVADGDSEAANALRTALEDHGYAVEVAGTQGTAIDRVESFRPDVAIVDLRLPHAREGLDLGRNLRSVSTVPLMFMAGSTDLDDVLAAFDVGGDDYLVKPFATAELLARVEALLRRAGRPGSRVYRVGDLLIDEPAHQVMRGAEPVVLTPIEFELLTVLARSPGRVIAKRQLLVDVWTVDGYDDNVVEVHVSALRRKLEALGPRLIHTVRGIGYVLRPVPLKPASLYGRRADDLQ